MTVMSRTIGQLAKQVGVPVSTCRFYERQRLLLPDSRSPSNYRLYGEATIERLKFIRAAQTAGFTLSDIRLLLAMKDGAERPCGEVHALVSKRLTNVREQMEHLRHVEAVLEWADSSCSAAGRLGRCPVLDSLAPGPVRSRERKTRTRA